MLQISSNDLHQLDIAIQALYTVHMLKNTHRYIMLIRNITIYLPTCMEDHCKMNAVKKFKKIIFFTCDWTFKLPPMVCNKSFNMLNILLVML